MSLILKYLNLSYHTIVIYSPHLEHIARKMYTIFFTNKRFLHFSNISQNQCHKIETKPVQNNSNNKVAQDSQPTILWQCNL